MQKNIMKGMGTTNIMVMIKNTLDEAERNKYNNSLNPSNKVTIKTETQNNTSFLIPDLTQDAANGLYITKCFYKNQKTDNIYNQFTKIVKEEKSKKGKNISSYIDFNKQLLTEIQNEIYFSFFFPFKLLIDSTIGLSNVYVVQMDILELPFKIDFKFEKAGNNTLATFAKLNGDKTIEEYNNNPNFFEVNTQFEGKDNKFYKLTLWEVINEKKTYTQFIDQIISKKNPDKDFKKVSDTFLTKDDIIKNAPQEYQNKIKENNYPISDIKYSITPTKITGILNNNEKSTVYFKNKTDNISKKIHLNNNKKNDTNVKSADDYWELCINTNLNLPNDGLTFSNYYDISFDCAHLKTFMYSYNVPGYYVLGYEPEEIYRETANEHNQFKTQGDVKDIINFNNVYIDIFKNKIIELKLEKI